MAFKWRIFDILSVFVKLLFAQKTTFQICDQGINRIKEKHVRIFPGYIFSKHFSLDKQAWPWEKFKF